MKTESAFAGINAETQRTPSFARRFPSTQRRQDAKVQSGKTVCLASLLLCVLTLIPCAGHAATNDLTAALQKGLFEEEANRNLDAAISNYQSLAAQFDKDRQVAATAIFRLGECYRKLGRTNDAVVQYERIVREFPDQQTLATLSRQNLAGMGMSTSPVNTNLSDAASQKQLSLLAGEIKVVEQQLAAQQQQVQSGTLSSNAVFATQQKLIELQFKQQLELKRHQQLEELDAGQTISVQSDASNDEEEQEIRRVQQMIQNSPDLINAPSGNNSMTPLERAAFNGQLKVAAFLLEHGADVNLDRGGALNRATDAGNRAMVEFLLAHGADVNLKNGKAGTPLCVAARNGYQAVVETLLANKADVNAPDNAGNTPLHWAARGNLKIVSLLLAADANPDLENNEGRTPLSFAAESGSPEAIKILLAAKADPNSGKLDAPLLCAIHKPDAASAELLLQAGANPNAKGEVDWDINIDGTHYYGGNQRPLASLTPLFLAISTKQLPMVNLLLKFKADPNDSQTHGRPLLFSALSDPDIFGALLDAGGKVDSHLTGGMTLLDYALNMNFSTAAVEVLLQRDADPNVRDSHGNTPLHYAVWGSVDRNNRIGLLLDHQTNPNVRNDEGKTPLDYIKASLAGSPDPNITAPLNEIADLLRRHGALDNLPHWDRIEVSRPSANFSQTVFQKGTNDWNHFTLLEALLKFYQSATLSSFQQRLAQLQGYSRNPAFPNLAQVTIVRHRPGATNETRITVNLLNSTNGIDCSKDIRLEFGDVVEVPEREHALGDKPIGLTDDQRNSMVNYLKGSVQFKVRGGKVELPVYPYPDSSLIGSVLKRPEAQGILLSSSDLSRVKVTRRDTKTGKTNEWVLDCHDPNNVPDLWLRDGDVIEVPEK